VASLHGLLGVLQAHARDIEGALKNARTALSVASTERGALKWALLALLLTARKEFKVALPIIEAGLLEVGPQEQLLLFRIKARVHQIQGAPPLPRNCQEAGNCGTAPCLFVCRIRFA